LTAVSIDCFASEPQAARQKINEMQSRAITNLFSFIINILLLFFTTGFHHKSILVKKIQNYYNFIKSKIQA
jgi:hypothetical protein